ncbi:hypothetical protein [Candidatus Protochlamydia sp. R18]|uniref:hypothetical protein n=1 Tax=Candidatus Protochlamydia sp. R18 TaxID=1353977 RepID=UPI0005AB0FC6|nr:hypothetical protein [Candidatus Protochlamydia sp. R18]
MKYFFTFMMVLSFFFENLHSLPIFPKKSQEDYLSDLVIKDFAKRMKLEKDLKLEAIGGSVYNGIHKFNLGFRREGPPLNKDEARNWIIQLTEEFIKEVNANQIIHPYLRDYPISNSNVHISIYNYYPDGSWVFKPHIIIVSNQGHQIYYAYKGHKDIYDYEDEYETYEEALKKFRKEFKK